MDSALDEDSTVSCLCSVPDGTLSILSASLSPPSCTDLPSYLIHPEVAKLRSQNDHRRTRPRSDGDVWESFMNHADLSFYRSITDQSCLKVYHKDPAHAFSHAARPSNGDARVSASSDQITFIRTYRVAQWLLLSISCSCRIQSSTIEVALLLLTCHDDAQFIKICPN